MPNYTVNGKSYFFGTEIGQEAAEAKGKELFGGGGSKGEDKYSYENPEDEGVLQEITEGVGSGLIAIPQGIAELCASIIDLVV